jgi:hypothetical protein
MARSSTKHSRSLFEIRQASNDNRPVIMGIEPLF